MSDQIQPGAVISMESAALEFSNAFSQTVARLVTEKLELIETNAQLRAHIEKQQETIRQLEREINLKKSKPAGVKREHEDSGPPRDH